MSKRMFNTKIVNSDPFLDMPPSVQALYFHLGLHADDEGFVYPKQVMRLIGSKDDELSLLIVKKFVIPFESGVIVIKHWNVNNEDLRIDRRRPTTHIKARGTLSIDSSKVYRVIADMDAAAMAHKEVKEVNELTKEIKPEVSSIRDSIKEIAAKKKLAP